MRRGAALFSAINPDNQDIKNITSLYQLYARDIKGNTVPLSTYDNKVSLVVNMASQCGLTKSNYTQLEQLYQQYKNEGFEVLAFPCNQFAAQESGSEESILTFAREKMKVIFPLFAKVDVNGPNTHPIFLFLKKSYREKAGEGLFTTDKIVWNFGKFLVDRDGKVVQKYLPTTEPKQIEEDIVRELRRGK